MAFSDDAVLARLSSLNESHDSIATASQWIMFHRRHAERTAQIWLQRLKDSTSTKRLSLVYLANEVTQQSKARHRPDFVLAFAPIIAEALAVAYKGAPAEIQGKLRRVVEVWADRAIFEPGIQAAIEARMQDAERSKSAPKSNFGSHASSVPADLAGLVVHSQNLEKTSLPTKTSLGTADQDWDKLHDPSAATPSAPVYAARLNGLLRSLASAEGAVADSVKARRALISELEKLLSTNRTVLAQEEQQLTTLTSRKTETEEKRREVENAIMRTLPSQESSGVLRDGPTQSPGPEPERPEVEELTPPPPDRHEAGLGITDGQSIGTSDISLRQATTTESPRPSLNGPYAGPPASGMEMLSNLASQYQSLPVSTNGSNKRRRVESDEFPDLGADDGIDADVAEMLRKDSNGA